MTGAIVQRMNGSGVEIIIGAVRHHDFGPLIMVGMGGVAAELLADHAFRIPPVTHSDAAEMIRELRGFPLLSGYRGRPAADLDALAAVAVAVGDLLCERDTIAEVDLNPLLATADGAVALDALVTLTDDE